MVFDQESPKQSEQGPDAPRHHWSSDGRPPGPGSALTLWSRGPAGPHAGLLTIWHGNLHPPFPGPGIKQSVHIALSSFILQRSASPRASLIFAFFLDTHENSGLSFGLQPRD